MGFDRRTARLVVPNPAATITQQMNLRSEYIRPMNFKIGITAGDDVELRVKDADGRIWWLDAADKDYSPAVYTVAAMDDVQAASGIQAFDSVGVEVSAAQSSSNPVLKNPLEVGIINGAADSVINFELDYEYGVFGALQFVLPTAVATTSTLTKHLRSKYAQIVGFRSLSVGTSTTSRLEIKDADGKIVYLDAADKNYDAAELDKVLTLDDTVTGLTGVVPRASSGAAVQAAGRIDLPLVRSPITVTASSQDGNDEVQTTTIYYKTG